MEHSKRLLETALAFLSKPDTFTEQDLAGFTSEVLQVLAADQLNIPLEDFDRILEALRTACRQPQFASATFKNKEAFEKLLTLSGLNCSEPFPLPEAAKTVLNVAHQEDEARKRIVLSQYFDEAVTAFKAFGPSQLFLRLRFLFICTSELEGARKVVASQTALNTIFEIAKDAAKNVEAHIPELNELTSILFNVSRIEKAANHTAKFIEFAGSMLRVGGKQQTDIIRLKASSLNSFLNLPYDAVHGMSFELLANLKPGQILDLLKEVFDLNREQQSKINIPALSLSVLNLCDVEDSIRKTLRKAILPPKWDRSRKPEEGDDLKAKLIRSMRGSDPTENQSVGKFLLTLCQGKVYRLVFHIGYANAAGFLFNNNLLGQVHEQLLSEPVDYSSGGIHSSDEDEAHSNRLTGFNPITGKDESDSRPLEEMTEEEKEAETERVLQALEQLEKTGIVKMFKQ